MRNLTNARFAGTLDEAVADVERRYRAGEINNATRAGYEVEGVGPWAGQRAVLYPAPGYAGAAAWEAAHGAEVMCSGLGLGSTWRIVRVVEGAPDYRGGRWTETRERRAA